VRCRACAKRVRSVRELARKHVNVTQTRSRRSRSRRRRASRRRSCGESVVALPSAAHCRIRNRSRCVTHLPTSVPCKRPVPFKVRSARRTLRAARRPLRDCRPALTRRCTATPQASARTLPVCLASWQARPAGVGRPRRPAEAAGGRARGGRQGRAQAVRRDGDGEDARTPLKPFRSRPRAGGWMRAVAQQRSVPFWLAVALGRRRAAERGVRLQRRRSAALQYPQRLHAAAADGPPRRGDEAWLYSQYSGCA
jgi:hypothetical protein